MSHPEQLGFFSLIADHNRHLLSDGRVIEIGSYDVNGGVRGIIGEVKEYVGVDLAEGPGVDKVAYGHEVDHADGYFDAAVSGECFEHDPHWADTFTNMVRMTRPGGLVAFTCASKGRPEHGTRRSDLHESPGTQAQGLDYYRNLTEDIFRQQVDLDRDFDSYRFWYMPTSFDLYFAGVRSTSGGQAQEGAIEACLPSPAHVKEIRSMMSLPHRVVRIPMKLLSKVLDETRYQNVVLPYWRTLMKLQDRLFGGRFRRADHA